MRFCDIQYSSENFRERVIFLAFCNVYEGMNALHTRSHLGRPSVGRPHVDANHIDRQPGGFDWASQIKLAIVLSVVAALVTIALAGRVAEPVLIVGVIVVASLVAWARIEPVAPPVRLPARHR